MRKDNCPVSAYCVLHANSTRVNLYITEDQIHIHNFPRKAIITPEAQAHCETLVSNFVTRPKMIASILRDHEFGDSTVAQIMNMKSKIKDNSVSTFGELFQLLESHNHIPENEETFFVAGCEMDSETGLTRFVVTSKVLLRNIKKFRLLQLDGTNKLSYFDQPVIVLGKSFL